LKGKPQYSKIAIKIGYSEPWISAAVNAGKDRFPTQQDTPEPIEELFEVVSDELSALRFIKNKAPKAYDELLKARASASKHIPAIKQGLKATSISDIFAPAAIESGLIGQELKGHLRSALVTHCIGPDGSYCWKDFSDGTVLPTIAEAMVGRRPDMDLAEALCFVAPLQHNKDRIKLQGCHWWFQRHEAYAAF
jgi:hypothetical protein